MSGVRIIFTAGVAAAELWSFGEDNLSEAALGLSWKKANEEPVVADPHWLEDQRRAAESWGGHSPLIGGTDPLHLSYHWQGPLEPPTTPARLLRTGRTDRNAVVLVDSMIGWHRSLVDAGMRDRETTEVEGATGE